MIYIIKQFTWIITIQGIKNCIFNTLSIYNYYGIIGWGGAYENTLLQLWKCQNTIIRVVCNRDWKYPIKQLFEDFNIFNINQLHLKIINTNLKKHYLLSPMKSWSTNHVVMKSTRGMQLINYFLFWQKKKTCSRKVFNFSETWMYMYITN